MLAVGLRETEDPADNPERFSEVPRSTAEHILRAQVPQKRLQRLCAWRLLEDMRREINTADTGQISYSLAHSKERVLCAIGNAPVGCDIEKIRPIPRADRAFSPAEQRFIGSDPRKFFAVWCAKEAFLKMTGEGLSRLSRTEISGGAVFRDGIRQKAFLTVREINGYVLAVCGEKWDGILLKKPLRGEAKTSIIELP